MTTTDKVIQPGFYSDRLAGYRFRSRLEARWAVFFARLGIKYEYEKEGYDLDGVWYQPTFWLPDLECWVEVTSQEPTEKEIGKAHRLALKSGHRVHIFHGEITIPDWRQSIAPPTALTILRSATDPSCTCEDKSMWAECPYCHAIAIAGLNGISHGMPCRRTDEDACHQWNKRENELFSQLMSTPGLDNKHQRYEFSEHVYHRMLYSLLHPIDTPRLVAAYQAARSMEFEYHGVAPVEEGK